MENETVIGVSTSALFNMQESDWVFKNKSPAYYEQYMREREDEPLKPGLYFDSAKAYGELTEACGHDLARITLLSRNDGWTGIRAIKSCYHHKIPFANAVFTNGRSPVPYLHAYNIDLFISTNLEDVNAAVNKMGVAAFQAQGKMPDFNEKKLHRLFKKAVTPPSRFAREYTIPDSFKKRFHFVFDFDRVIGDHQADEQFDQNNMGPYVAHERDRQDEPLPGGPLEKIAQKFSALAQKFPRESTPFIVSVLTARGGDAALRAMNTLREMGIYLNGELHMTGGGQYINGKLTPLNPEKQKVLGVMRTEEPDHVMEFYDDSETTVKHTKEIPGVLSGLVPRQTGTGNQSLVTPPQLIAAQ